MHVSAIAKGAGIGVTTFFVSPFTSAEEGWVTFMPYSTTVGHCTFKQKPPETEQLLDYEYCTSHITQH